MRHALGLISVSRHPRCIYMAVCALLCVVVGFSIGFAPHEGPQWLVIGAIFPLQWWGAMWFVTAALLVAGIVYRRADRLAFTALVASGGLWSIGIYAAWVIGDIPYGWIRPTTYLLFTVLQFLVAVARLHPRSRADD